MIDWKANKLDVFIWDVAHGLSITIITPFIKSASGVAFNRRRVIQYDAGVNNDYKFFPISYLVNRQGLQFIDHLILSHPDKDHIDELHKVLELLTSGNLTIHSLIRNKTIPNISISEDPFEEGMAKTAYKTFSKTYMYLLPAHHLLIPQNFGGIEVQTTHLHYTDTFQEPNNLSVVVSIKFGGTQIIIPGDLEQQGAEALINLGWMPQADADKYRVLIAPHHGSKTAKPAGLLKFIRPHIVLASAEKDHEYTDTLYSSPDYVIGHTIMNSDGTEEQRRFKATKGEIIHIETYGYCPTIKKIPYKKDAEPPIRKTLADLLSGLPLIDPARSSI